MSNTPADGERAALRGYRWQYDHIAVLVYDAIREDEFLQVRLTDPEVGQVDDLVIVRDGKVDAYQFKSTGYQGFLTFNQLIRPRKKAGSGSRSSLIKSLADGWLRLRDKNLVNARVHLVAQQLASVNDHLGTSDNRPSPDHFASFIEQVLKPLSTKEQRLDSVCAAWDSALERSRASTGLTSSEFEEFVQSWDIELGAGTGQSNSRSTRDLDVRALSDRLYRLVSESTSVVELDRTTILKLMNWNGRIGLRSTHEFPVDLDTYEPLTEAVRELEDALSRNDSGYAAVIGPPGAGKSSLLTQALSGRGDQVFRYYAYVPATGVVRTRLTAQAFLHDLILMFGNRGVLPGNPELVSDDIHELRRQFEEHLDALGEQFNRTGVRTIVVVDGLDHVVREYNSTDSLLGELPNPVSLPEGLTFIVGSRTLEPLRPLVRHQLEEHRAVVDLQNHRLSSSAIIDICRRLPLTSPLEDSVHSRIARLSDGHPLALRYLLNRLRDTSGLSPEDALVNAPAYSGDVAAEYREVWDQIEKDDGVVDILAVCSRMRIAINTHWLETWADRSAVSEFRRRLMYLFRADRQGMSFFHDSFRQFVVERTCVGDDGKRDAERDEAWHARIAGIARTSHDARFKDEEFYHLYQAGEPESLSICGQRRFRDEFLRLREPHLILEDIAFGLQVAAEHGDVSKLIGLMFALAELESKNDALDSVDIPGLLFDCGLVDEAVRFCSASERRSPLSQIYALAGKLGTDGDAEGRRIFDLVEHDGFEDRTRPRIAGQEHDAPLAWVATAPLFRPLEKVIEAIERVAGSDEEKVERGRDDRWFLYVAMMKALVQSSVGRSETARLRLIDKTLADRIRGLKEELESPETTETKQRELSGMIATLVDLRFQIHLGLLKREDSTVSTRRRLQPLLEVIRGVPLRYTTMLDATEVGVEMGDLSTARDLLRRVPFDEPLRSQTLRSTGVEKTGVVWNRFRYWRLREMVRRGRGDSDEDTLDFENPSAIVGTQSNFGDDSIALFTKRLDRAIRWLGWFDAVVTKGKRIIPQEIINVLESMLRLFSAENVGPNSFRRQLFRHQQEFMNVVVGVAENCGNDIPQRMADAVERCFMDRPDDWPPLLRLQVGEGLMSANARVQWYRKTLEEYRSASAREDVYSRLDTLVDVAERYVNINEIDEARTLAKSIISMSHGVGFRKDYQFDIWVAWLGRVLSDCEGDSFVFDAAWLARVLSATNPLTEGAPSLSAATLVGLVARTNPGAAVRIFEYSVRQGEINHIDALAELLTTLVSKAGEEKDWSAITTASNLVVNVIASTGSRCYQELGQAIVSAARVCVGSVKARELARSIREQTDIYALPTARSGWQRSLEFESKKNSEGTVDVNELELEGLILNDSSKITAAAVSEQVSNVGDILELRGRESPESEYSWVELIEKFTRNVNDINRLVAVFDGGSESESDVLLSLATLAEKYDDADLGSLLAIRSMAGVRPVSWSRSWGGTRVEAAALACRLGGRQALVTACLDLARAVSNDRAIGTLLVHELDSIVLALEEQHEWSNSWREVREFIKGMERGLELPDAGVFDDKGNFWWLAEDESSVETAYDQLRAGEAIAEVAVRHLSHPTWVVRDGAIAVVAKALGSESDDMADSLSRFLANTESDDVLEAAGRALAAARHKYGFSIPSNLSSFDHLLATHSNHVLRELSEINHEPQYRSLSPLYRMTMPPRQQLLDEINSVYLGPYEERYSALADLCKLDIDAVTAVAERYQREILPSLPKSENVGNALASVNLRHVYRTAESVASRIAFGRVVSDLCDARELDMTSDKVRQLIRTVDIGLLAAVPEGRPEVVPVAPQAGHEQTTNRWLEGLNERLEEYVSASTDGKRVLLGAVVYSKVLNWGDLGENYYCGTVVGSAKDSSVSFMRRRWPLIQNEIVKGSEAFRPSSGQPIVIENDGVSFQQYQSDWIAFDPRFATSLGWISDPDLPGNWLDLNGNLMVESIWWVDGWLGRSERVFDDTEAMGYSVIATKSGIESILSGIGEITRVFELYRNARDHGELAETKSACRTIPLKRY